MDYLVSVHSQLSQHLRAIRKSLGMTQAEMATRMGVTQSRVSDMEKNPGTVSVEHLLKLLNTLGVQLVLRKPSELGAVLPSLSGPPSRAGVPTSSKKIPKLKRAPTTVTANHQSASDVLLRAPTTSLKPTNQRKGAW